MVHIWNLLVRMICYCSGQMRFGIAHFVILYLQIPSIEFSGFDTNRKKE